MIAHQAKKMTEAALLAFRDRFELPLTDQQVKDAEYYKPPDDAPEMVFLRECRAKLGGSLPVRRQRADAAAGAGAGAVQVAAGGHRRARGLDDDGVRPDPVGAAARQDAREADRADRARRVAHVRDGGPVPPGRDLLAGRPALPAAGFRAADVLQGGSARPDPRGGHHRGRLGLVVRRRRHLLLDARDVDGAVLHLLLDVRLPAGRRPDLGRRRQPHARVPDGRDRRAHDAQRRGAAARGRPQPPAVLGRAQLPRLRPGVRLRAGGDHPGRPAPHARRAGGRLLLRHPDERELPAPGDARRRAGGDPARDVPAARGVEAVTQAGRAAAGLGDDPATR